MKKTLSSQDVEHVAKLANLPLTESEAQTFSDQLSAVIDYNVSLLVKVETEEVEPTTHASGLKNVTREDDTEPGLTGPEALQNAKATHNNFFKVKAILDQPERKAK